MAPAGIAAVTVLLLISKHEIHMHLHAWPPVDGQTALLSGIIWAPVAAHAGDVCIVA